MAGRKGVSERIDGCCRQEEAVQQLRAHKGKVMGDCGEWTGNI